MELKNAINKAKEGNIKRKESVHSELRNEGVIYEHDLKIKGKNNYV